MVQCIWKACQNGKNCMELNTPKNLGLSQSREKYPESNKCIDEQPQHIIDFNLVGTNEKDDKAHSQYKSHYYLHTKLTW